MNLRHLILICLLSALLGGCATGSGTSYPNTPARGALIDRIIDRAMQASRIGTDLREDIGTPQSIARKKTVQARAADRTGRSDAYWHDYEGIELSYAALLAKTDDLALEAYRKQMQAKLSYATDEELMEFANDQHLLDNNGFFYLGRRYDLIRNDYVAFRKIYPVNCLRSYVQAMDTLEKNYPAH